MSVKSGGMLGPILYYIGLVIIGLGLIQLIPITTSLLYREWDVLYTFMISAAVALLLGCALSATCAASARNKALGWGEGMVVSAASWLLGMLLGALPYYLSGHYLSYLDACFDVMSGLTTTGLVLIQGLDHVSNGVNMWRHLLTFVGGQGMVVLALSFLVKGTNGAYKMYVGEGKDERLKPNVVSTARYIWLISLIYLAVGTLSLWIANMLGGQAWDRALLHGMWLFMSAWSTGGFGPMSQNMLYYHSTLVELLTLVFCIIGSFNFALHYAVLTGKTKELARNIETVSMTVTLSVTTLLAILGLMRNNVYPNAMAMFRKGFYQLVSGHTTTGFMSIYAKQFQNEWGDLALFAITIAMLIGGSACSTAGGFKGIRMGIILNAFRRDVKRMTMPESMVSVQKYHHIRDVVLDDSVARSALLIVVAYIITFALGTVAGLLSGYPLAPAAFESASVTGNVGLSIGVTQPAMPAALKVTYIVIMWVARLEFMSVLALGAYIATRVRRRWRG